MKRLMMTLAVSALSVCLPACHQSEPKNAPDAEAGKVEAPPAGEAKVAVAEPDPDKPTMTCTPAEVGPDTELTLVFPPNHAQEFAIIRPGRNYISIAESNSSQPSMMMTGEAFAKLPKLVVKVKDIIGTDTYKPAHRVFVKDGDYRLLVGPEIYTEEDNQIIQGECTIKYRASITAK